MVMKKLLIIYAMLLLMPIGLLAQNDSISKTKNVYKNQVDLNLQFLGIEISYERKLLNRLSIGYSIGGGALFRSNGKDIYIERIIHKLFLDFQLTNKFHISQGVTSSSIFYSTSDDNSGVSIGIETGLFFNLKKIELGFEPSIVFFSEGDWRILKGGHSINNYKLRGVTTSLLILRIPLSRW